MSRLTKRNRSVDGSDDRVSGHVGAEVENWRTAPGIAEGSEIKVTEDGGHPSGRAERKLYGSEWAGRLCALCVKS